MKELKTGDRVVRGRDWSYGCQDSGENDRAPRVLPIGIVQCESSREDGWYEVEWPRGYVNSYRYGDRYEEVVKVDSSSVSSAPLDAEKAEVADPQAAARAVLVREVERRAQREQGPHRMSREEAEAWSNTLRMKVQAADKARREQIKGPIDDPDYA